jgi:hypothetical protein
LSAEKSPFGSRATQVLAIFANIGLGNIAAGVVFLILLKAFEHSIADNQTHLEWVWRLLLGVGILPAAFTLYARLTIEETEPYKQCEISPNRQLSLPDTRLDVCNESTGQKRGFTTQWKEFREYFSQWRHAKVLFATAASWFLL